MKITETETIIVEMPLQGAPVTNMSFGWVMTKVHTDEGIVGLGEGSCVSGVPIKSEQSHQETKIAIDKYLAPAIKGMDPFDIGKITEKMDQCFSGHHRSKTAIEIALWDIVGKTLKIPVYKLLGGLHREWVPASGLIGMGTFKEVEKQARDLGKMGCPFIKIKLGSDPASDPKKLKLIREVLGEKAQIEVDFNQAYSVNVAIRALKKMERYDPESFEQPVVEWDLDGMAKVAKALDTPIIADESCRTSQDALRIIKKEAADVLNIKIMEGGIGNARNIASVAEAANIPFKLGSEAEMAAGWAATAHFGAAVRDIGYFGDQFSGVPVEPPGYGWLNDTVLKKPLEYNAKGIKVPMGHGLGIELDETKLKRYTAKNI